MIDKYQLTIIFESHVLKIPVELSKNDIKKIDEALSQRSVLRYLDKISGRIYTINTRNVLWFEFNVLKSTE